MNQGPLRSPGRLRSCSRKLWSRARPAGRKRLISRPQAGRGQFEQVAVRIAEINAVAAARPMGASFNRDAGFFEAPFPGLPFVGGDGKSHVDGTLPVVRRYSAAGELHGLQRMAAQKQQQHAAMTDVVSAKPGIAINAVESKDLLIERTGALECLDVEHGFQNAEKSRHLPFPFPMRRCSRGIDVSK